MRTLFRWTGIKALADKARDYVAWKLIWLAAIIFAPKSRTWFMNVITAGSAVIQRTPTRRLFHLARALRRKR